MYFVIVKVKRTSIINNMYKRTKWWSDGTLDTPFINQIGHHILPEAPNCLPSSDLFLQTLCQSASWLKQFAGLWQHTSAYSNTLQHQAWLSLWEAAGSRFVSVLRAQGCSAVSHYISDVAGMLWAEVSRKPTTRGQQHFFKMFFIMLLSREAKIQYVYLCRFRVFLVSCL